MTEHRDPGVPLDEADQSIPAPIHEHDIDQDGCMRDAGLNITKQNNRKRSNMTHVKMFSEVFSPGDDQVNDVVECEQVVNLFPSLDEADKVRTQGPNGLQWRMWTCDNG